MSVMTTTEKAGYDALVSGSAQAVKKDGSVAFTAVQSGVDPTAAANFTTRAYTDLKVIVVRACTTSALASYTYANGTAGVGATLTATSNGAIAAIDNVTLAAGDEFLLNNGAAFSDNGVYVVTTVGDAGTPFLCTRSTRYDTQAKVLSSTIKVAEGTSRRGAIYEYRGATSITFGTTALAGVRVDSGRGLNEFHETRCDFDHITIAPVTGGTIPGDAGFFFTITGTGAATVITTPSSHTNPGVLNLSTGTTTTGLCTISHAAAARQTIIDASQHFEMEIVISGPDTLSDGTNTFRIIAGLADNIAVGSIANGVYLQYTQGTSTSWLGTNRASSVDTNATGSTVSAGNTTYRRFLCVKYAGESSFHWYDANAEMTSSPITGAPLGTNLTPVVTITKSAGTTTRSCTIDSIRITQYYPNGRAA